MHSLASFLFVFVALLLLLLNGPKSFLPHDAGTYWAQGMTFERAGHFALKNFTYCSRGYAFPLALHCVQRLSRTVGADPYRGFLTVSALLVALLTTVLVPAAVEGFFGRTVSSLQRLGFALLVVYFWRSHFSYPLTDFPAVVALLGALGAALAIRPVRLLLCGVLLAFGSNARPVYLAPAVLLFALVLARSAKINWRRGAIAAGATLVGASIVMVPQAIINRACAGIWSPFVLSDFGSGGESLYLRQLSWGMGMQRYETSVGSDYPVAQVRFLDREGAAELRTDEPGGFRTLGAYLVFAIRHPSLEAGLLARHAFNGLDLRYDTPYLERVYQRGVLRRAASYSVLVLAVILTTVAVRWSPPRFEAIAALAVFLSPVAAALPTAVEPRYFLPASLAAYGIVTFFPYRLLRWPSPGAALLCAAAWVAAVLFCWDVSDNVFASLEYNPRTVGASTCPGPP